jgi:hypothetical protein
MTVSTKDCEARGFVINGARGVSVSSPISQAMLAGGGRFPGWQAMA